jgi:hypothetical protein
MTMLLSPQLSAKVDDYLDDDGRQQCYAKLGQALYDAFSVDVSGKKRFISSQVRNLQQAVMSAVRFSDIEIFIKNQMGKETTAKRWKLVGQMALDQLKVLREQGAGAVNGGTEDATERRAFTLALASGWIGAVVGEYLYKKAQEEIGASQHAGAGG